MFQRKDTRLLNLHTNPHAPVRAPPKMKKYSVAPVSPVAARKSVYYEQKRVRSEVAY
jgi:hypothetical protein